MCKSARVIVIGVGWHTLTTRVWLSFSLYCPIPDSLLRVKPPMVTYTMNVCRLARYEAGCSQRELGTASWSLIARQGD